MTKNTASDSKPMKRVNGTVILPPFSIPCPKYWPMFVEILVRYSALLTFLVGWHACAVASPCVASFLANWSAPQMASFFVCIRSN